MAGPAARPCRHLVNRIAHGSAKITIVRLRLGIVLWLLSWVPYGVLLGLDGASLTIAWTAEILLGIAGLALAGAEFAKAIKGRGWRGALTVVWTSLIHGKSVEAAGENVQAAD